MRKFILSIVSLVVISALVAGTLSGCEGEKQQSDTLSDTSVIKPAMVKSPNAEELSVEGEVVDGAKSMVTIQVTPDSTADFTYENLDKSDPNVFEEWDLDTPTKLKITYVKVMKGNMEVDSVTRIQKVE
ncbi:MAG: hypothetical protein IKX63_02050 [Muribaculaceae bacterium]|nr:hypothetical protein [Muribaculaceae bacterium]